MEFGILGDVAVSAGLFDVAHILVAIYALELLEFRFELVIAPAGHRKAV